MPLYHPLVYLAGSVRIDVVAFLVVLFGVAILAVFCLAPEEASLAGACRRLCRACKRR